MTDTERQEMICRLERAESSDEIAAIEAALGVVDDDQGHEHWLVPTLATVAEFFDVHEQTVKGWRSEGMPESDGGWNLREIVRWRIARAEKRGADTDESSRGLTREKLKIETECKRLDLEERQGKLVYRDAVEGELREMFSVIRSRLQALPGEMAASVPSEVRGQVMEESTAKVTAALKELAKHGTDAREESLLNCS